MNAIAFDIETLQGCFCIVAHDTDGNKFEYVKSNEELVEPNKVATILDAFTKYDTLVSYNGARFDIKVLAWISKQTEPIPVAEVATQAQLLIKDMNDKTGHSKMSKIWNVGSCANYRKNHHDILKNYVGEHSLKWWELARGWSVKETDVAWDKPFLTEEEIKGTLFYCHHDVEATMKLFLEKNCQENMEARQWLIDRCEVPILPDATIAELSETYTYGNFEGDEEGTVEELIDWYSFDIPTNVLDGFMAVARRDSSGFVWHGGTGKLLFLGSEEYNKLLKIDKDYFDGNGWATFGLGGAHYCRPKRNRNVHIFDVASLYPSIIQHHLPLKCKKAQDRYVGGKLERIRIKRLKGTPEYSKPVDMGLKLNLNSLSGKFRMKGARAYAPNHGLAMCLIGQLLIVEATWAAIGKSGERWGDVVEINTDSFAVVGEENIERAREYTKGCLDVHKFEFEEDVFVNSYWKDVNHYVVYNEDGSVKEDHGFDKMKDRMIVRKSLIDIASKDNVEEPYIVATDNWKDYLVKFAKSASSKNASIDNVKMDKKYYYFIWTTKDCPNRKQIRFNGDANDTRYGVVGFSPEELEPYSKYIDNEQYLDDLRKTLKNWHFEELAKPPVRVKRVDTFFEAEGGLF